MDAYALVVDVIRKADNAMSLLDSPVWFVDDEGEMWPVTSVTAADGRILLNGETQ